MHATAYRVASKIAFIYIFIGVLWIIFSDQVSYFLSNNGMGDFLTFQRYKGWFFVLITGIVLFVLINKRTKQIIQSTNELKEKELELQANTLRYQSLFQQNPDAVFELSKEGMLLAINSAGQQMFQQTTSKLIGTSFLQLVQNHDSIYVEKRMNDVLKGDPATFEITFDGPIIVRMTLLPIVIKGDVTGLYGIAKDITEHKRNEELMIKNEKMYVIGQLAASVAHEIRNPLTSIKGFIQLMKEGSNDQQSHLQLILSEIERIEGITSEMLYLGKNESIQFETIEMTELIHQVTYLIHPEAKMYDTDIHIHTYEKPVHILGDPNLLKQVFINLLKNSIEAIKMKQDDSRGNIDIDLYTKINKLFISIKDNGIGMDEDRIKRLGEPFYSTKEKGTGLGLAVSMKIMKRHHSTITFHSKKNNGTTVILTFPMKS